MRTRPCVAIWMTLLLAAVLVAGCSAPAPAAQPAAPTSAPAQPAAAEPTKAPAASSGGEPVTIVYASSQWAEGERGQAMWDVVEGFNKTQDKIKVEKLSIPYSDYEATILTQLGAGTGPCLMEMDWPVYVNTSRGDYLSPVGDVLDLSKYKLVPQVQAVTDKDGKVWALPWEIVGYRLIYNQELLDKAGVKVPTTYDEFLEAAKKLTGNGVYGFAYRHTANQYSGWWYDLSNWVFGQGGRWVSADGKPTINSKEVVDALRKYKEFYDAAVIPVGADASTYRRMAGENKIAMMIDNSAVPPILLGENPNLKLGSAPPPFKSPTSALIIELVGIPKACKNKEAAAEVLKYILQPDVQQKLGVAMGGSVTGTAAELPADFLASRKSWLDPYSAGAADYIEVTPPGLEKYFADIRTIVLERAAKVLIEGMDPQAAMDEAQAEVEKLIAKGQ